MKNKVCDQLNIYLFDLTNNNTFDFTHILHKQISLLFTMGNTNINKETMALYVSDLHACIGK